MGQLLTRQLLLHTIQSSQMTRWFDLSMLSGTLRDIAVSSLFGDRFDCRASMTSLPQPDYYDYDLKDTPAFWFDYTADVGDGWNPTYAIASLLCEPSLAVQGAPELPTGPGRLLIMGGDQVYPTASRQAYEQRLVVPYRAASYCPQENGSRPSDLFAIPGNHDWYDGLGSFLHLFARERNLGRFRTRQHRSYFALKLPHGVWLLAIDGALSGEIDFGQTLYFHNLVRTHIQDGDRLILCTAKPDWVASDATASESQATLFDFEEELLAVAAQSGRPHIAIALRLSGDLHYYKHFESTEDGREVHSLIAGGGGAFLHPTHTASEDQVQKESEESKPPSAGFRLTKSFPSPQESRAQTRGSLFLFRANPSLWLVLLLIYLLSGLAYSLAGSEILQGAIERTYGSRTAGVATAATLQVLVLCAHALALFGCCYALVDVSKQRQRAVTTWEERDRFRIAIQHAMVHIVPYALLQLGNSLFDHFYYSEAAPYHAGHSVRSNLIAMSIAVVCSLLSAIVFWAYLQIALSRYGRHANDAFAALRIEDYKNFLRIEVKPEKLVIYAIGLRSVPQHWEVVEPFREGTPCVVPASGEALRPELIERFEIARPPIAS